ncbi:D-alanyl-D-alanine endopeptidase [Hydrogenophaga sp.]|uniref:D-alanyl-D-alanine endopeptidase n=1 Tax=Hydrogenophaga sp. TaxID=1904254 RepID=UPI002731C3CE|nr:D-alanyl-D-alanine endopeptidase [Hydrogenophaga sp.]MDP2074210.1 D-alanyl-D-alanine endopeptidase [Hydrogenophaga sp.]MDP3106812.1 D-alanyl-D-alanine endopeptidase [Hydrogenophaga sp.]
MINGVFRIRKLVLAATVAAWMGASVLPAVASAASSPAKVAKTQKAQKSSSAKAPTKHSAASAKTTTGKVTTAKNATKKAVIAKKSASRVKVQIASGKKPVARQQLAKSESRKVMRTTVVRVAAPARLSMGEQLGLRASNDRLDLNSSVALVIDQETNEVLFSKNDAAVLPIASLTKLMTGLVIADANLDMNELITITQDDVDTHKGSSSRLAVGSTLSRGEMMHLALMSSENRAANALGRTYPGGLSEFVRLMNSKAKQLGMTDTRYVEPTGLSSLNQSSARDLATLVSVAHDRPILRSLSTSPGHEVELGRRTLHYNNSNRLIKNPDWDIGLQKTGYISEAGRCLVMQAKVAGRQLIMVFLDSTGKLSRLQDAERVRRWVEVQTEMARPAVRPQG